MTAIIKLSRRMNLSSCRLVKYNCVIYTGKKTKQNTNPNRYNKSPLVTKLSCYVSKGAEEGAFNRFPIAAKIP